MKLENKNTNYCATVIRIKNSVKLTGLDRLVGINYFGCSSLVDIQTAEDTEGLYLFFTAETQLSKDFASNNNLFRHQELNVDKEKSGYLEDSGRIKALKLKGNVSSALVVPVSSLAYLGVNVSSLKEGDSFTHVNGVEVCRKYVIRLPHVKGEKNTNAPERFCRIDKKLMPEHIDSENWWKNEHKIPDDADIVTSQKIHGTSGRFANQVCNRKLTWKEKIAKFFGCKVQETEFDYFAGSRRVIKDRDKDLQHFYKEDIWNYHLEKIKHVIPKNWILYGEIAGYVGDKEIQPNYSYRHNPGESTLYIYRIAVVNPDGVSVDLSWDAIVEYCKSVGLNYVPELFRCKKKDFDVDELMNIKYNESGYQQCVRTSHSSPCDEGVCVRVEGMKPFILKAKSPLFLTHETKQLDTGVADIETQESDNEGS